MIETPISKEVEPVKRIETIEELVNHLLSRTLLHHESLITLTNIVKATTKNVVDLIETIKTQNKEIIDLNGRVIQLQKRINDFELR
jgi:hypothetical protein